MNNKKIAFIICVNNEQYFKECIYYINRLRIPQGYETDVIAIREAVSMCEAYQLGMKSTDARYKIYMHQDVFIRNTGFIEELRTLFNRDENIGMIGMVGGGIYQKTALSTMLGTLGR